ncbi:hypothetical protein PMKS-001186 [Pichia membranifaciens]|uniref:SH3 domain-containing protein n=1 Tax=Pichia membranifaciens TaxID=4926 RepID=A0A1Q2YDY7_9ASCO|nr:hypothetical protein PMKS-001186 [Pichia membranifaciens]
MMTAIPPEQLYARSFWSIDSSPQEVLILQNEKATKTLNSLSSFYKEFMHLENDYSRRFNTLLNRLELPKHENAGTLKTSINVFHEQCLKVSESHSLQARRIQDALQQPLLELISDRKAREKAVEMKIRQSWNELTELRKKCASKSIKYEDLWSSMSSLKRTRMTLDNIEAEKLEQKLSAMKTKMLIIREENWELVNRYNEKLDAWLTLWWDTCNEWQAAEEKRIRFLKSNLWEFANILSLFCVEEDQFAENIRVSLQDCSAKKDINYFVDENSTGLELLAPLNFIDFAKNETRPVHEQISRNFDILEIPTIRKKVTEEREIRQKKRNPPPKSTKQGEMAFSLIGKSKETFNKLQEEAQKEVSQMKINKPESSDAKSISEPSTYQTMSDYSNPTTRTSISSHSFTDSLKDQVLQYKKINNDNNKRKDDTFGLGDPKDDNPVRNALINLRNEDKLRESMSPVKENSTKKDKHNSFAHIMKNAFNESPGMDTASKNSKKFEFRQLLPNSATGSGPLDAGINTDYDKETDAMRIISHNSLMIKNQKNSLLRPSQRQISSSMRKSKSQMNLKNRHISLSELPSHSSEGYPVISYTKAQYNYTAAIEEELSFKKRDILLVLHKQSDGWWFAENLNSSDSGLVPSNYLVEI